MKSSRPASIVYLLSAGGVVFRKAGEAVEVALIGLKGGEVWTLPKGLVDGKENVRKTALREVREETGLEARILREIGESHYWYNIRSENQKCRKTVRFFLMEYIKGGVADHDEEVDDAQWFALETARGKLTYKGDRHIMEKASAIITRRLKKEKAASERKSDQE